MIDADDILQAMTDDARKCAETFEVFPQLGSTNTYLQEQAAPETGRFRVAIAEHQTEGRGRQGKSWIAPPSAGLCLSVSYTFDVSPPNLPSLALAAGVGIASALETMGVDDVALKWPNDIVARDGKLGGILTEVKLRSRGRTAVVGLGLNVDLPAEMQVAVLPNWTSKVTDLEECVENLPSRPLIAAGMLQCLFASVTRFETDGFAPFHAAWGRYDWLEGRMVTVPQPYGNVRGTASGLDSDGALLVQTAEGMRRVVTGSVTVASEPGTRE